MQKSKPKQLTFEQEHNIALSRKDPLQMDYSSWAYLYQSMKNRGLNEKQIRKNMNKYQQNVLATIQNTQHVMFDKSRNTMKQKMTQLNHQLRIRLSEVFQFISMLHMEQLQELIEFIFGGFMLTIERMVEVFEELREGFVRMEGELEDWKLRKRNVLCFSCHKNLQQSKMRNLQSQIGTTISTQIPQQLTDNQHKVQKISSQCKTLQMQLQAMSEQHFFTLESDDLIEKINEVLKTRIITSQKHEPKQTTSEMLASCLNQLNEVIRPFDTEYGAGKDQALRELMRKGKKGTTIVGGFNALTINDLNDTETFTNKLLTLFSQPLHRFVLKYQTLLSNQSLQSRQQLSMEQLTPLMIDQQTQTSLIKPPQAIKILQKQLISQNRQLSLLKTTKQKIDKDLYAMYDTLKQNQTKIIQIATQNKLLQQQKKTIEKELKQLKAHITNNQSITIAEKQLIIKTFSQQKSQLTKEISTLQKQLQLLKQQNTNRSQKVRWQNKEIQTYKSSLQNDQPLQQRQTQTQTFNNNYLVPQKKRLRRQRTFRSFKMKNNINQQQQQQEQYFQAVQRQKQEEFSNNNKSNQHMISTIDLPEVLNFNKKHTKTREELTIDNEEEKLPKTARHFPMIQEQQADKFLSKTLQHKPMNHFFNNGKALNININQTNSSIEEQEVQSPIQQKQKLTSIKSMIPEAQQNSKSHITNNKFSPNKCVSISQSSSDSESYENTIFNDNSRSNIFISGRQLIPSSQNLSKNHQISQQNLQHSSDNKKRPPYSTKLQNSTPSQEELEKRSNGNRRLVIHNFNQISAVLTDNKDIDQILVSKLKKVSKQQFKKENSTTGMKSVRKSAIRTSNETPNNESVQNLLHINQLTNKQNQGKEACKMNLNEMQINSQFFQKGTSVSNRYNSKKQKIIDIINQNFEYLDEIGVISMIEENETRPVQYQLACQIKENTSLNQLRQILKRSELQKLAQHIQKSDIQLFFSLQQASKYENRIGLWNQYESCMMIDNNFSKLVEQVERFFNYLKANRKVSYNEYLIFLSSPSKFMREIADQKNNNIQKQRVLKETIKMQKSNAPMNKKGFVKETFKKLIRLHRVMHRNGCNHVEKFLQKIGFYDFQSKTNTSNQRSLQKNKTEEEKLFLPKSPISISKGLKI